MTRTLFDAEVRAGVAAREPLIRAALRVIHEHPELAHAEFESAGYLVEVLRGLGLTVETGIAGMDTAFRATLRGSRPGRTVGLVALYDAVASVPERGGIVPVHSCGHGPIAAGVLGAAAALAAHRNELAGTVVVMGCPADEIHAPGTVARGGGKAISVAAGAWDDIDAALYAHPEYIDTAWRATVWMRRDRARVSGVRRLDDAAAQPELAAVAAAVSAAAGFPRTTVMLEHLDVDGDVEEGGGLVTAAQFLIWAPNEPGLDEVAGRLREALPAEWQSGVPVPGIRPDAAVNGAVIDALRAAGRTPDLDPPPLPFATDFGAISQRVPGALIGIGRPEGWAFHTPLGAEQFASEAGMASAMATAEVLALTAVRLAAPP